MKRNAYLAVSGAILLLVITSPSFAQTKGDDIADFARHQKKEKQGAAAPAKVYDNDNLPRTEHISVVGSEPPAPPADPSAATTTPDTTSETASGDEDKKSDDKKPVAIEPGQSPEDRQQAFSEWQSRIKEQKAAVDLAQRELDVTQREYRLRSAVVATDVGYRLRNSADWDKEDRKYKEQIAAKQKAYDEAKQKLADLQEQARKAGAPSKVSE